MLTVTDQPPALQVDEPAQQRAQFGDVRDGRRDVRLGFERQDVGEGVGHAQRRQHGGRRCREGGGEVGIEMTAGPSLHLQCRRDRSTRRMSQYGLFGDVDDTRGQGQPGARTAVGNAGPVPAFVDVVQRREGVRAHTEPLAEHPARLAAVAHGFHPRTRQDLGQDAGQPGSVLPGPSAQPEELLRHRRPVGRI
ncbi:hypothetical protein AB0A94_02980 [Streptomyces sp. NPDC044984]|uniref:hypothetical protein n=1 Tax=Streptomyces sp. NPDC044984 TaxID=3154335 RepID=UPI0033FBACDB